MRRLSIALSVLLFSSYFISCHSSSDQLAANADSSNALPAVGAIHSPEFRQQVKKQAVAGYKEDLHDRLNKDWVFSVRLYETDRTLSYRIKMQYEELQADDTLKLPDLGTPPQPVIQAGKEGHSCMIGFMDNDHQFREYKLVSVKGDQLTIRAIKHYSVTQGYRLVSE